MAEKNLGPYRPCYHVCCPVLSDDLDKITAYRTAPGNPWCLSMGREGPVVEIYYCPWCGEKLSSDFDSSN